jgi:hypothetical protein
MAARGSILWGSGPLPSVTTRTPLAGKPSSVLTLYEWPKGQCKLAVNFEYLLFSVQEPSIAQLAADLRAIPGITDRLTGLEAAGYKKRPTIPIESMTDPTILAGVFAAVDALVDRSNAGNV